MHKKVSYTQSEVTAMDKACYDQIEVNKYNHTGRLMFHWVECKKSSFMDIEIKQNPMNKDKIIAMYDELLKKATLVDEHKMDLGDFYKYWDDTQSNMYFKGACKIWLTEKDHEARCVDSSSGK